MTRTHYRTLANDLGRAASLINGKARRDAFAAAIDAMIPTLYDDNGRFDRETFTDAMDAAEAGYRERRAIADTERAARLAGQAMAEAGI